MNIPLLGSKNAEMASRSFEDALLDLLRQGLAAGLPPAQVGMACIGHGLSIHTQAIVRGMIAANQAPPPEANGHAPEPPPERGSLKAVP